MKKVMAFMKAFGLGLLAGAGALIAVIYGRGSRAADRYQETKELEDEIERKASEKAKATKDKILAQDPHSVVDSLPESARADLERIDIDALEAARKRSKQRTAELLGIASGVAPTDRG